jgi:hypothetical protein
MGAPSSSSGKAIITGGSGGGGGGGRVAVALAARLAAKSGLAWAALAAGAT